jgi:hypothetical protein
MTVNGDFTFERYADILQAGLDAGYEYRTVRAYCATASDSIGDGDEETNDPLPERMLVLRHDVDRKPENALKMARVEARFDVPSTYYFRTVRGTFRPELIQKVIDLGHEVGYHYEDVDRANGDRVDAHRSFERHLRLFRSVAEVETVCMHGNPLTPHDNRDLWADPKTEFERYGLLGEAYLSMDFTDVTYFSDTGRTWRDGALKIKDHTMGEGHKTVEADTTGDLVALLSGRAVDRACLLAHPNRWADSVPELVAERAKDTAINVAKRGLNVIR